MFLPRSRRPHIADSVPGLGTAAPLTPGLWSRPFMEPIRFHDGSSTLDAEQQAQLDELAMALSWFSTSCTIEVRGHAWGEGGDDEQCELSKRRAELVRGALIERGLPPWVLRVRACGSAQPVSRGAQGTGDAVRASRRVELWLHQRTVDSPLPCSDPGTEDCCRAC